VLGIAGFFSHRLCERLRSEIRSSRLAPAQVRLAATGPHVNEGYRRTQTAQVTAASQHLAQVQPWICRHFQMFLAGFEPPQFLLYRPGDFFARHSDGPMPEQYRIRPNCRKISVVVFLNGEGESNSEASFTGGALSFHRFDDPATVGVTVTGAEGLLVAFPAFQDHEVMPVVRGERLTVVSWYF
jgi:predicted 2-oxoglutarate/Fe(II)-dependent dioxygenase YbiX